MKKTLNRLNTSGVVNVILNDVLIGSQLNLEIEGAWIWRMPKH